jgi:VanZ family protein
MIDFPRRAVYAPSVSEAAPIPTRSPARRPRPGLRFAAFVLALALIANLFITGARPEAAGLIPAPWDKLAHVTYYAVLAVLLWIADAGQRPWVVGAALLAVGAADEWHQAYLPGRESSVADFATDGVGIALGLFAMSRFRRGRAGA